MSLADDDREAQVAAGYRVEAEHFRAAARNLRASGQESDAWACDKTASDLTLKALAVERHLRGIEPLCPGGG